MTVLITGANGLLGQKLVAYCLFNSVDFWATSKGENRNPDCPNERYADLDITNKDVVIKCLNLFQPTHIVHTAAITNVDYCELNEEECTRVNVIATEYLIDAANSIKAYFQFVSTDFVFDGIKGNYSETDEINPLGIYARSKAIGERLVQEKSKYGWSIVRTIIVYGKGNNLSRSNIIIWAKEALERQEQMNIIDDQFRAPTFADDLAAGCMGIIENNLKGIFHISGPETMSVYEIVDRIAKHYGYSMKCVNRISSDTLNQPAKRPPKTGFNLEKAYVQINYKPKTLEESLDFIFN